MRRANVALTESERGTGRVLWLRAADAAFLIRVASAALVYLTQVLFARWMGTFEFGVYAYVWTWVLLLGGVIDLGLASSAQRFIPEYMGGKQFALLRGFLAGSRWLVLALATGWALLAALVVWLLGSRVHSYEVMPLYLACVALPILTLGRVQDGMARSFDWINLALMPPYVIRSVLLIVVMGAAWWLGLPTDASTAIIAALLTTWITVFGQTLVMIAVE